VAGVSVGTVSNVLNRPDFVSEPTRRRVQDAMHELGFVRNATARQLRAGHSQTVGVVVLDAHGACVLANPWVASRAELVGVVRTVFVRWAWPDPATDGWRARGEGARDFRGQRAGAGETKHKRP